MSNPNLSVFCPSCPVRINGHCEGEMSTSTPVNNVAGYIDILNEAIGDLRLVTDVWAITEPDEREKIKNDVDEAAIECAESILGYLDVLPELETVGDAVLLDLGACATRISNGECERVKDFRDTL